MAVRGIDTQMLATKPADLAGNQVKANKQIETQMAQNATTISKNTEQDKDRTIKTASSEGKKIGTEEREKGNGSQGERERKDESEPEQVKKRVDPMLLLPVEKGKYAKPKSHHINIEV